MAKYTEVDGLVTAETLGLKFHRIAMESEEGVGPAGVQGRKLHPEGEDKVGMDNVFVQCRDVGVREIFTETMEDGVEDHVGCACIEGPTTSCSLRRDEGLVDCSGRRVK